MRDIFLTPEFVSAVAGAVVGGSIAFALNWINLRNAEMHRKAAKLEVDAAHARSLLFKLVRIYSFYGSMKSTFDDFLSRTKDRKNLEKWQIYSPILLTNEQIYFDPNEMSVVISLKDDESFNILMEEDISYNFTKMCIMQLNDMRRDLEGKMPSSQLQGQISTSIIPAKEFTALRPQMVSIGIIFDEVYETIKQREVSSRLALERLQSLFSKKLGIGVKFEDKRTENGG